MADQPNTRMEEMLKAYAEKRRQEAGPAMELHPATRQMLQTEVSRTYKHAPRASWLQRMIIFWPRLAFAGACLVITLTLVLIVLPQKKLTEMAQRTAPSESESLERLSGAADKEKADAYALRDAPAPTLSTAPVPPTSSVDRLAKLNEADDLKAKSEVAAEARKDGDALMLAREEAPAKRALRESFSNVGNVSRARYKQQTGDVQLGAELQTVQPILNNFEFEQTGNRIRLLDEDGSVYSGNMLSSDEAKKRFYRVQQNAPAAQSAAQPIQQQGLFFAFGTNLSLKQEVSIEANILQWTNTNALPALAPAAAGQNERGAAQNIISGRARVGTNQEVLIRAVPVQQP